MTFAGVLIFARRLELVRRIALSMLIPYLFLTFVATVISRSPSAETQIMLEPFRTYRKYYTDQFTWFEIRANVLMFVPIGFLLLMTFKNPVFSFIGGVSFSIVIELLQLILHRGLCETDDLISNTIGLVIGMAVYTVVRIIVKLFRRIIC